MNTITKLKLDKWMLGLIAIALLAATCLQPTSKADNPHKAPPSAVYVTFKASPGTPVTNQFGVNVPEVGLEVKWVSRSQHAPEILPGHQAGEVIALLHYLGYQLTWLSAEKLVGMR